MILNVMIGLYSLLVDVKLRTSWWWSPQKASSSSVIPKVALRLLIAEMRTFGAMNKAERRAHHEPQRFQFQGLT
jgi:hypothetical protein